MRKFFTLLLGFLSVTLYAQTEIERTVTFDFSNPESLTPSIEMGDEYEVSVNGMTFTEGPISLKVTQTSEGVESKIRQNDERNGYRFIVYRHTSLTISCNGVELKEFHIAETDINGGLVLAEGQPGSYFLSKWTSDGQTGITSVKLTQGASKDAIITKLTVTYTTPLDVLTAKSITPSDGATVEEFKAMSLLFDYEIASTAKQFSLKNEEGTEIAKLIPSINGKTVTLTPSAALTEAGAYSVTFPENSFVSTEGYYNKAFSTSFTYVLPKNSFNPVSITPAEGSVDEMPETIELDFRDPIGNRSNAENPEDLQYIVADITDTKTGVVVGAAQGSLKSGTENILVLTSNLPADARTKRGIYTVTIPEHKVFNRYYNTTSPDLRYNSEIVITYKVAGADAPSEDVLKHAREILEMTGVGYPKADAAERTALKEAVDAEDKSDEDYLVLINDFVISTDIELPAAGKYYTIANVQKNGTKYYLAYDGEAVSLTSDAANAYSFKASATDDTDNVRTFSTADGKYLHTLVASTNYSEVTPANVTSEKKPVSSLSLVKMPSLNNVDVDRLMFGTIAMSGLIGKKNNQGEDITAYSNVLANGNIAEVETSPYFTENLSGAFTFTESIAPAPETSYTVTPANGAVLEIIKEITLVVNGAQNVNINSSKDITITGADGTIAPTSVTVTGDDKNIVKIAVNIVDNGTYTLNVAKGALNYDYVDRTISLPAFSSSFTLQSDDEFVYDFDQIYHVYTKYLDDKDYNPSMLNDFAIYTDNTEFFINNGINTVWLFNYDTGETVATGTLEKTSTYVEKDITVVYRNGVKLGVVDYYITDEMIMLTNGKKVIITDTDVIRDETERIYTYYLYSRFNKTFTASNTPDGRYGFITKKGSFGDSNYGDYLASPSTVTKKECHLNARGQYYYDIKASATGIENVENEKVENVIYDMMGRKLSERPKHGMYIINGKKYIVK